MRSPVLTAVLLCAVSAATAQVIVNNCREIDREDERIYYSQHRLDSTFEYAINTIDVTRYFYDQGKLDSMNLNGELGTKVTYPAANQVRLTIATIFGPIIATYYVDPATGRTDSARVASFFLNARFVAHYTENTMVSMFWNDQDSLLGYDSVAYGASTRTEYNVDGEGIESWHYCRSAQNACLCYADAGFTTPDLPEHSYALFQDRVQVVKDDLGEKVREHFWPGGPLRLLPRRPALWSPRLADAFRADGRRLEAVAPMRYGIPAPSGTRMPPAPAPSQPALGKAARAPRDVFKELPVWRRLGPEHR